MPAQRWTTQLKRTTARHGGSVRRNAVLTATGWKQARDLRWFREPSAQRVERTLFGAAGSPRG